MQFKSSFTSTNFPQFTYLFIIIPPLFLRSLSIGQSLYWNHVWTVPCIKVRKAVTFIKSTSINDCFTRFTIDIIVSRL